MGNVSQVSLWFWSINGNNKLNDVESTWTKMVISGRYICQPSVLFQDEWILLIKQICRCCTSGVRGPSIKFKFHSLGGFEMLNMHQLLAPLLQV